MVGAPARRPQVAYARRRGLSSRGACAVLSVARSTLGYTSRLQQRDAPVMAVMRELAGQYPRYGYRKIRIFLARRGHAMSAERTYRLWRQAGLQVPRRRPRRRVAPSRPRPLLPTAMNHVWAYDFVFDTCADGRSLKCLPIVDEFTRECLAIDVAGSIRSGRVIDVLAPLVSLHGAPRHLRSSCYDQVVKALGAVGLSNRDSIEAWDEGNPYYINEDGKKQYAYHPDDTDDAIRLGVRERRQENAVDKAEDRRVGADGERQRHDGDRGKPRTLAQGPKTVSQILKKTHAQALRAVSIKTTRGRQPVHELSNGRTRAAKPVQRASGLTPCC